MQGVKYCNNLGLKDSHLLNILLPSLEDLQGLDVGVFETKLELSQEFQMNLFQGKKHR